jgi:putative hydrolase of HD superfamily
MKSEEIIKFLGLAEKLKCELRHSWTSTMRQESVAEHSWRLCVFSWLLKGKLQHEYDMDKVMKMCLFHDLGEAIAGDIPSFSKNEDDIRTEEKAVSQIIDMLDEEAGGELAELFLEMKEQKSKEARLFNALDKLEAVIQHNESPIETWIPLEFELNKVYANEEVKGIKVMEELREAVRKDTLDKLMKHSRPEAEKQ